MKERLRLWRVPLTIVGLATWLFAGLGVRVWLGGQHYLYKMLGSQTLADGLFESALSHSFSVGEVSMRPVPLLATVALGGSIALTVAMWPVDIGLRRLRVPWLARAVVAIGISVAGTASALLSIHPLLARRSVPEGPRTMLNYACEAAGYDWINGLVYSGVVAAAVALVWLGRMATPTASEADAAADPPTSDADAPGAEPSAPGES